MTPPTDETVRLIREEVIDADRLSRYYGYLAQRLRRLGELLGTVTVCCSLAYISHHLVCGKVGARGE